MQEDGQAVIPRAQIELLGPDGQVLHTTLTNASGVFLIQTARPGEYRLRAEHIGFAPVTTDPVELAVDSVTHLAIRMGRDAVPLDPLEVVGRRVDQLGRATYAGMYQRWGRSPSVGTNRVILPHEREFRGAWRVKDVLSYMGVDTSPRAFGPSLSREGARCMVVVFWRGRQIRSPDWALDLLETPVDEVEGIEIYTDPVASAPLELRPVLDAFDEVVCATVALWPIRGSAGG